MNTKLSLKTKLIYGAGDIGFSLTSTIIGVYFLFFLTDVVNLDPAIAGIALLIGRIWDYVNDPLIGHISDRTKSRWGRRRPFLLFGAFPFAAIFTLMWLTPDIQNQIGLAAYYAFAYVLFDLAATFVYMPYFALTPDLTDDYDERTSLTSYRMFFSIAGGLVAFTVPAMIIGDFVPANGERVFLMAAIFGLVSALPLLLVFFNTRERHTAPVEKNPNIFHALKLALKNRPFVFGAIIYLVTWTSMGILETVLLYFINYVVARGQQSDLFMGLIFGVGVLALPLWNWVSKKLNKRMAYVVGISFWAFVQMMLITLGPASQFEWIVVLCVLAGIGVSAAHVLPWSILPDSIEYGEFEYGERHEGVFYSLVTLMAKMANSIAIPTTAFVLYATGYIPNSSVQPQSALTGIRLLIGPIPAFLLLIGIVFALRYPLDREQYKRIVEQLKEG